MTEKTHDNLVISVYFHDGRYHGSGDWPPSPARLFQALLAGVSCGNCTSKDSLLALRWLESLNFPWISAPHFEIGKTIRYFVPNNELDVGFRKCGSNNLNDAISKIRNLKIVKSKIFDNKKPIFYIWKLSDIHRKSINLDSIYYITNKLFQLGSGVDMAWAVAETCSDEEIRLNLEKQCGNLFKPSKYSTGNMLSCPEISSLDSLLERYNDKDIRYGYSGKSRSGLHYIQPRQPHFRQVAYECHPIYVLFDLENNIDIAENKFFSFQLTDSAHLTKLIRECVANRFKKSNFKNSELIDKVIIGIGALESDKDRRVRIIPLPSIGHKHADLRIRRVLVEIPSNCPISKRDIDWAFSGLSLDCADVDKEGLNYNVMPDLVRSDKESMLKHYGSNREYHNWETVTAAALPIVKRNKTGDKSSMSRITENAEAIIAVQQSLRHANILTRVESIQVQREPFSIGNTIARNFRMGTRFSKKQMWHVRISFSEPVSGPILIGNGRYLGLGLMKPLEKKT